jgi:hypothetical protein
MSRTRKKPYRKSRRFDKGCRCHGSCPYCRDNRLYSDNKRRSAADQAIADYWRGPEILEIESYERDKPELLFFVGAYE